MLLNQLGQGGKWVSPSNLFSSTPSDQKSSPKLRLTERNGKRHCLSYTESILQSSNILRGWIFPKVGHGYSHSVHFRFIHWYDISIITFKTFECFSKLGENGHPRCSSRDFFKNLYSIRRAELQTKWISHQLCQSRQLYFVSDHSVTFPPSSSHLTGKIRSETPILPRSFKRLSSSLYERLFDFPISQIARSFPAVFLYRIQGKFRAYENRQGKDGICEWGSENGYGYVEDLRW